MERKNTHLAILMQGVAAWNEWITEQRRVEAPEPDVESDELDPNLLLLRSEAHSGDGREYWMKAPGETFRADDEEKAAPRIKEKPCLVRVELSPDKCRDTPLWDEDMQRVDLRGVDLAGVDCSLIRFRQVDLTGAVLDNANLQGARFENVVLVAAKCSRATLSGAYMENTVATGAVMPGAMLTRLQALDSTFREADLRGANLAKVGFTNVDMSGVLMAGAQAAKARMRQIVFNGANMQGMDLREAVLEESSLIQTNLSKSRAGNAIFRGSIFKDTDFTASNCNGADFQKAVLLRTKLFGASLRTADMRNADLRGADLRGSDTTGLLYNRYAMYKGIRLEGCHGAPAFRRLAKDQEYIEDVRGDRTKLRYWLLYLPWLATSDCGRSLALWAGWALVLATGFGVLYHNLGYEHFAATNLPSNLSTMIYSSIITFTTLGFGDLAPKTGTAAFWITIEVILGYIMLGGLVAIFTNKLARRS